MQPPRPPSHRDRPHLTRQNLVLFSEAYKSAFFKMDFPRLLALFCPEGPAGRLESAALFVCLTGLLDGTNQPDLLTRYLVIE